MVIRSLIFLICLLGCILGLKIEEDVTFNLPDISIPPHPCFYNGTGTYCIPSVISPGVQKCGTTFLYSSLTHHPEIAATNLKKEVNFYSTNMRNDFPYGNGIEFYSTYFSNDKEQLIIDFSPVYMMIPNSAELIRNTTPHMKFIITLRDPVDRTYSHYRMEENRYYDRVHRQGTLRSSCADRKNVTTFKHYLQEEYDTLGRCRQLYWNPPPIPWNDRMLPRCKTWRCDKCMDCFPNPEMPTVTDIEIGYMSHSLYVSHIKHFFKYFPRENFFFVRFEDIIEKGGDAVLNEIVEWLGLPTIDDWDLEESLKNANDYTDMNPDEEEFLTEFFRIPNQELYDLLGRDFEWRR